MAKSCFFGVQSPVLLSWVCPKIIGKKKHSWEDVQFSNMVGKSCLICLIQITILGSIMIHSILRHAHVDAEYRPQDAAVFPKALPNLKSRTTPTCSQNFLNSAWRFLQSWGIPVQEPVAAEITDPQRAGELGPIHAPVHRGYLGLSCIG